MARKPKTPRSFLFIFEEENIKISQENLVVRVRVYMCSLCEE